MDDAANAAMPKLHSPASERNREPILEILRRVLPERGTVLSIASGSGEHDVHFARALPKMTFQPSDADQEALTSILGHRSDANLPNLARPVLLDVLAERWPVDSADAIININMIHIAPWAACEALFRGAARLLERDELLFLYGPFIIEGRALEPSNARFDQSLRERNPEWGLRMFKEVESVARSAGFRLDEMVAMPANNTSAIFRRTVTRTWTVAS